MFCGRRYNALVHVLTVFPLWRGLSFPIDDISRIRQCSLSIRLHKRMVHNGVWGLLPMVRRGATPIRKANTHCDRSKSKPKTFRCDLTTCECALAVVNREFAVSQFATPRYRGDQDSCAQGKGPYCPVRRTRPDSAGTRNQSTID